MKALSIHNQIVQGVAAGQIDVKDIEKACTEYFRGKRTLDRADMNSAKLKADLSSNKLKNEVIAKISEPMKKAADQKVKRNIEAEKQQQRNAARVPQR